tara:strand:+ start:358 stop:480 length:123 start_codon:yes stop_codon:yes gene_type:complete
LPQLLEKYPHLAELHLEESLEQESVNEESGSSKKKDLLLG